MNDDAQLVDQAAAGNSAAFGQLVTRYQDRLYNTLVHVVGSSDTAQDVVQDAFVQAYVKLDSFERASGFYTWLYRIAINLAISRRRREKPTVSVERARDELGHEPIDRMAPPHARLDEQERACQVRTGLATLSEEHRAILILREVDGCAYEQIAEILDLPIGTIRSRLHRARLQLRDALKGILQEEPNEHPVGITRPAPTMTDQRREELISAYLDGELAPDERADVERWLAESPELRQLHDELAALSGNLRSLPRHSLDRDLGSVVLRRAERTVLGEQAGRPIAGQVGPRATPTSWWLRGAGWGRLKWPVVAVAAALLIMVVTSREREVGREVAQAPKQQGELAERQEKRAAERDDAPAASAPAAEGVAASEANRDKESLPGQVEALSAPAPATAAGAPGGNMAGRMARAGARQFTGAIVVEVSPQFFASDEFEKLAQGMKLTAVAEEQAASLRDRAESEPSEPAVVAKSAAATDRSYLVEATDDQLAELVAALRKKTNHVKQLVDLRQLEARKANADEASSLERRQRFVLRIRTADPPANAEPQP